MEMKHPFQGCECNVCHYFLKNGEDCYGQELRNSIDLHKNWDVVLDGGFSATVSYVGHKREYHVPVKADMEREIGVTVQIHKLDNEEAFLPFRNVHKPFVTRNKTPDNGFGKGRASYPPFTPPSFSFDVDHRKGSAIETNRHHPCHTSGVITNGLAQNMGDQFLGSQLHRRHVFSNPCQCHSPYQNDPSKCNSPHRIDQNRCHSPHWTDANACRSPHFIDPTARRSPHWIDPNTCYSPLWIDRNSPRSCGGSRNSDSSDSAISTGSHHMHNYDHINLAKINRRCSCI